MLTIRRAAFAAVALPLLAASASTAGAAVAAVAAAPTHAQAAAQEDQRLLDAVALPAGTVRAPRAPVPALAVAPQHPASATLLDASRFWTSTLSAPQLLASLQAHPPRGLRVDGVGSSSGGSGDVAFLLATATATATGAYADPQLLLAIAVDGTHSALRADAQTIVLPDRTAAEHVPTTAGSVDLLAYRFTPAHPLAHHVVRGDGAGTVAAELNALPVSTPGPRGCLQDSGFRVRATFAGPHGPIVATVTPTGCAGVLVTADGRSQVPLGIDPQLVTTLLHDLHLTDAAVRG